MRWVEYDASDDADIPIGEGKVLLVRVNLSDGSDAFVTASYKGEGRWKPNVSKTYLDEMFHMTRVVVTHYTEIIYP